MSREEAREASEAAPSSSSGCSVPGLPSGKSGRILLPGSETTTPPSTKGMSDGNGGGGTVRQLEAGRDRDGCVVSNRHRGSSSSSSSSSSGEEGVRIGGLSTREERRKNFVNELTNEQFEDMCYSFSLFDTNGDGTIDGTRSCTHPGCWGHVKIYKNAWGPW